MNKVVYIIIGASLLVGCSGKKTNSADAENEKLDKLAISSTNDKVSYAIGFTSAGELVQFAENPKFAGYFSAKDMGVGFFEGVDNLDTTKADDCNTKLSQYFSEFRSKGTFDTTKIRPSEASHCLGFLRATEVKYSLTQKKLFGLLSQDLMKKGFRDGLFHTDTLVPVEEQVKVISDYFGAIIKKEGEEFLAKNKMRPEVTTSENGLQLETIVPGTGKSPAITDSVSVYYTLSSITGQVIESNMDQPTPITFALAGVIEGWKQGLQLMKTGGQYKLYVPYELGYGFQGSQNIRPYSALIFEIKLVAVKK